MKTSPAHTRSRKALAFAFAISMATACGCASLFGIDEPTRDECAGGACEDATATDAADASRIDAAVIDGEGPRETAVDSGAPDQIAPRGIRCGSDAGALCTGTTICCETDDEAGLSYACAVSAAACIAKPTGYAIECAAAKDCHTAGDLCCHFHSSIKCVPAKSCSGETVCDPNGDDCPAGKACNVPLLLEDPGTPYLGCAP